MKWGTFVLSSPNYSLVLKPWNTLTKAERHREVVRHALRHRGSAFTLNLGSDFEAYLASSQDPMRAVAKRMNAELRKMDLHRLPLLTVLEASKEEKRLHLHGVYIENGLSARRIQHPMRRAVGYVKGRGGSRQFKSKRLYAAEGWANYLKKDSKLTRRILNLLSDDRLCWTSRSMTQRVRDEYENTRLGKTSVANSSGPVLVSR